MGADRKYKMEEKALLEAECDMLREQLQLLATATIGDAAEAQAENDTLTQEVQALKHQLAQQGADLLMTSLTAQTQHAVSKGREEDAFFESLLSESPKISSPRSPSANADRLAPPPVIQAIIEEDWSALDASAQEMIQHLRHNGAAAVWHKHGNFLSHLRGVFGILKAWGQAEAVCRFGMFHSVYANSYVAMGVLDPQLDRAELQRMIGYDAEALVHKFCVIDRDDFEQRVMCNKSVPAYGFEMTDMKSGGALCVSAAEAGIFLVHTAADYIEQFHSWQEDLHGGAVKALWPGEGAPLKRMHIIADFLEIAARDCSLDCVPPVFDQCTATLKKSEESAAVDAYWTVVQHDLELSAQHKIELLCRASDLNPYVGEPHVLRAQTLAQEGLWKEAIAATEQALAMFYQWGTSWDKRMAYAGWVSWARVIKFQSEQQEWPSTSGGVQSLGAVNASQRKRELNVGDTNSANLRAHN